MKNNVRAQTNHPISITIPKRTKRSDLKKRRPAKHLDEWRPATRALRHYEKQGAINTQITGHETKKQDRQDK